MSQFHQNFGTIECALLWHSGQTSNKKPKGAWNLKRRLNRNICDPVAYLSLDKVETGEASEESPEEEEKRPIR